MQKPWLQYSLRSVSCQLCGTVTLQRAEACNEDEALRRVCCQFYRTVALQSVEAGDEVKGLPLNLKVRINKKCRTFFDSQFFHFPFD